MSEEQPQELRKVDGKLPASPALFGKYLNERKNAVGSVAASFMNPERLTKIILRCVAMNPQLQRCTMDSVFRSALMAAELGLEPGSALGEAYFVPYGPQCTMIPGYRGLVTLARRSGEVEDIWARAVFADDQFEVVLGTSESIKHVPGFGSRDPNDLTHVYCVAKLRGTEQTHFDIMTRAEVDKIRGRSAAAKGATSPWHTDYVEMAKKTVVRRAAKMLPMSVEMVKALALENAHDTGKHSDLDFDCIDGEFVEPARDVAAAGDSAEPKKGATDKVKEKLKGDPKDEGQKAKDEPEGDIYPEIDPATGRVIHQPGLEDAPNLAI